VAFCECENAESKLTLEATESRKITVMTESSCCNRKRYYVFAACVSCCFWTDSLHHILRVGLGLIACQAYGQCLWINGKNSIDKNIQYGTVVMVAGGYYWIKCNQLLTLDWGNILLINLPESVLGR